MCIRDSGISGLVALDDVTLRIDLVRPRQDLPELLATPALGVVGTGRVGTTGPWEVQSENAQGMVLHPSDQYQDQLEDAAAELTPGEASLVETIEVTSFADASSAASAFDAGEVDLVWLGLGGDAQDSGAQRFVSHVSVYLGFNTDAEPWSDQNRRDLVAAAIDRTSVSYTHLTLPTICSV